MKKTLLLTVILATFYSRAQDLTFKIAGLGDTTVYLTNYFGKGLYFADTAVSKNDLVTFDGSKHQPGLYAIYLPGAKYFDFVHDREPVYMIVANQDDFIGSMEVQQSRNNAVFYEYVSFMTESHKKMKQAEQEFAALPENSPRRDSLLETNKELNKKVRTYQENLVAANPGTFVAMMVNMAIELELPEPPRDAEGNITDSAYVYNYYIAHYWDRVDLKNPYIVNTPVFHNKLDKFFSPQGLVQIPDSIIRHAVLLIDKMELNNPQNKVFQYTAGHVINKYASSKIMGMDKIVWALGSRYYCSEKPLATWMTDQQRTDFCDQISKLTHTLIGDYATNIILTDSTEKNWINMYQIPAKYTVLYFWSPTCGHCKKTTPQLQELYEKKFQPRGVEVYAVAEATGSDFELWKKFIAEHGLKFINVGLTPQVYNQAMKDARPLLSYTTLESLNYGSIYDISTTPRIFVLDQDKKILFKQLALWQLEEVIDELTGHAGDKKLVDTLATAH